MCLLTLAVPVTTARWTLGDIKDSTHFETILPFLLGMKVYFPEAPQ